MSTGDHNLRRKNGAVAALVTLVAVGMVGASYAAVPLYRLFCQVTGFKGTTRVASAAPGAVGNRVITVRFDANVAQGMPWQFAPVESKVNVRVGEEVLAFYIATNPTDRTILGSATFNVAPFKAGPYFDKVQCFCFTQQTLKPGQTENMGVSFFIDPAILKDRSLDDVTEITLSYTFFEVPMQQAAAAAPRAGGPAGGNAGDAPVDAKPVH